MLNFPLKESIPFDHESGYSYEFTRNVVKMKEWQGIKSIDFKTTTTFQNSTPFKPNLNELSWTKEEILWKDKVEKEMKAEPIASYNVPKSSGPNRTELELDYLKFQPKNYLKHIVLFKNNDPNFIRIYPSNVQKLFDLEPTSYTLYLLWNENGFSEIPVNQLHTNGMNLIHIQDDSIQKATSRSNKIDSLVQKSVYGHLLRPLEKINETYRVENETFTIDWSKNEHFISGYVYDSNNEPLPGVSVQIKGTNKGVTTDANGRYRIYGPQNAVLIFSFVGYNSSEKLTHSISRLDVNLEEDSQSLEEVVVTGYGVEVRKNVTGSVVMQGKVAGVAIRGATSLSSVKNENELPIFVLNGKIIPKENFDETTMEISEILKGQTAVALYGSEAQNGVYVLALKSAQRDNSLVVRKNFKDVAFWQPKLRTDAKGRASFKVKFPDDITTWKTTIVATTPKKQSGMMQTETKAFRSVSANLIVPRFMVTGDSCQVYGKAKNYREDSLQMQLRFMKNDSLLRTNNVNFGGTKTDSAFIYATSKDSISVIFGLQTSSGIQDAELRKIPVLDKGTSETNGVFGFLNESKKIGYAPNGQLVTVYLQANPIELLKDEISHLHNYQYLCNEQLASKLKGYLVAYQFAKKQNEPFEYEKDIKQVIKKLLANENEKHEWGWWNVSSTVEWISTHVLETLFFAKNLGFEVNYNFSIYIQSNLYSIDNKRNSEKLHLLQLIHKMDTLVNIKPFIPPFDSLKNLSEKLDWYLLQQQLEEKISLDSLEKYENRTTLGGIYYGNVASKVDDNEVLNTLKAYLILKNAKAEDEKLDKIRQYFYEKRINGYWRNTYESAKIIENIQSDFTTSQTAMPISKATIWTDSTSEIIQSFPFKKEFTSKDSITIINNGNTPVFATIYEKYHNENPPKVSDVFDVKTYFMESSDDLKTGKKAILRTEIEVKNDAEYVMLEVPIPAGCSYENEASNYWWNGYFTEQYKNKTNFYFTSLKKGNYVYDISLINSFSGKYTLNPAKIELMYFPTFYGREEMKRVKISN